MANRDGWRTCFVVLAIGWQGPETVVDMNNSMQQTMDYPTTLQAQRGRTDRSDAEATVLLITVDQAARMLGCGRSFAYNLVLSGDLVTVKLGRLRRVPVGAVHEYIAMRMGA